MNWDIRRLDAAQAEQALPDLVQLLQDAVASGASVGFLPPLDDASARAYWRDALTAMADGSRILLAASRDDAVAGSVQLDLCPRPNGRHRAEVMKLLVHTGHRRQGLGRALMQTVEAEARRLGRTTLVLDTLQGSEAEGLYASLGWSRAGVIPAFARGADGGLYPTVYYYKLL